MRNLEGEFVNAISQEPSVPFRKKDVPEGVEARQIGGPVNDMGDQQFGRNNRTHLREIIEHAQVEFRRNNIHDPTYLYRSEHNSDFPYNGWDRGMVVGAISTPEREETVLLGIIDNQTNVIVPTDELLVVGQEEIAAFFAEKRKTE